MKTIKVVCDVCKAECDPKHNTPIEFPKRGVLDWCPLCYTNLLDVIEGRKCFPPVVDMTPNKELSKAISYIIKLRTVIEDTVSAFGDEYPARMECLNDVLEETCYDPSHNG